ncbi:DUF885 domain-containing protein [Brevundimonas aveniformis]|uniref:DUF885 domain-containing protein n=1 Tax=Brevundimonas aveniformis TaxID=370977 RepID=UPI0024923FA2|nr:DUF885 family protein [Brevundimonas aveniformis]
MRKFALLAATALIATTTSITPTLAQTSPAAEQSQASAALASIITDYETWAAGQDPFTASAEGDRSALSRLPDASREGELARREPLTRFRDRLAAINPDSLNPDERLNHTLLSRSVALDLERIDLDQNRFAFNSEGGPEANAGYLAGSTRITTVADAEAWLERLGGLALYYDAALDNARRGIETGMVQPRIIVDRVVTSTTAAAAFTLENDPLMRPMATRPPSISEAAWADLTGRARGIIVEQIVPVRQRWATFMTDEYLPASPVEPGAIGLGQRPGGREAYAFFARWYTTTEMTPDEIHALGLSEVARIRAQMQEEMAAAGWTGSFADFLTYLRTDPQFYVTTRDEMMMHARDIAKRADDQLPALFNTLPRLPYGVRPVPEEIEANYTTGRYNPGSSVNGIAGAYMVNTSALDQRGLYELPALTLHEAVPGHHLQIALQQELGDLPWFRRNGDATAFVEGWGLYSEFLGYEMGIYRTPYERFGRLSYEMWRACRLVADTGIHWMGWDIEQARACFRDNSALSELNIQTELERYISWPGQALAYKIGELTILRARRRAEEALGDDFNVRRFHDAVLLGGPVPMEVLEQRIDTWIAAERERAE